MARVTPEMKLSIIKLLAAVYLSGLSTILKTQPLGLTDMVIVLAASSVSWLAAILLTGEIFILKVLRQSFSSKQIG